MFPVDGIRDISKAQRIRVDIIARRLPETRIPPSTLFCSDATLPDPLPVRIRQESVGCVPAASSVASVCFGSSHVLNEHVTNEGEGSEGKTVEVTGR